MAPTVIMFALELKMRVAVLSITVNVKQMVKERKYMVF
jgi:hypothetical protein